MEYSRNDLPRKAVRSIYGTTCKVNFESLWNKQMTTEYSWPNNTKDLAIKAKLHQPPDKKASEYYLGDQSATW